MGQVASVSDADFRAPVSATVTKKSDTGLTWPIGSWTSACAWTASAAAARTDWLQIARGACTRSWIARAAAPSTSPRASTGKASAGGIGRVSGRSGSSLISSACSTIARIAPGSGDMAVLVDANGCAATQKVVEIEPRPGRQCDADAPALGEKALGSGNCGALADAVGVVVGADHDHICRGWQHEAFDPSR